MARPKEFDRDEALQRAIGVFCEKGYAAASIDQLMHAMKIRRQSMYDTYGDKRSLYLEAFRRYTSDGVSDQIHFLEKSVSPLAGADQRTLTEIAAFALRSLTGPE